MGHSFIEFRNQTKMMTDGDVIIITHVILDVARPWHDSDQLTDNIKGLLNSWNNLLDVYGPGCLDLKLDQFILTEADRNDMLELTKKSCGHIQNFGAVIPGNYLNQIVNAPEILEFFDRPKEEILVAFDKFMELIGS